MLTRCIALTAAALCAIWAQGVVLCAGDEGQAEIGMHGSSFCPADPGDWHECVGTRSPDRLTPGAASSPGLPPPAESPAGFLLPGLRPVFPRCGLPGTLLPAILRSVVLVV